MLFTLEKLIYKVVKQLQTIVQDDLNYSLYQLYRCAFLQMLQHPLVLRNVCIRSTDAMGWQLSATGASF